MRDLVRNELEMTIAEFEKDPRFTGEQLDAIRERLMGLEYKLSVLAGEDAERKVFHAVGGWVADVLRDILRGHDAPPWEKST